MNMSFDKIKGMVKEFDFGKAKENTKEFILEHYKMAGTVLIAGAMVAVCTVNLAERISDKNTSVGIMMTVSTVSAENEAFAGKTFDTAGISYAEMTSGTYEKDELAQLEKTEKQIDEILSAKSQARKDQAALEAMTATYTEPEPLNIQDTVVVTAPSTAPTYADENGTYEYVGEYVLTAYCPCPICCGSYSNMENPTTASGTTATAGRTIAAPSNFAFGTQLVINGQVYTVEDRGGAITGNKIDIFFSTHEEALAFGRRTASVYRLVQ